jgi:hypothetical protein
MLRPVPGSRRSCTSTAWARTTTPSRLSAQIPEPAPTVSAVTLTGALRAAEGSPRPRRRTSVRRALQAGSQAPPCRAERRGPCCANRTTCIDDHTRRCAGMRVAGSEAFRNRAWTRPDGQPQPMNLGMQVRRSACHERPMRRSFRWAVRSDPARSDSNAERLIGTPVHDLTPALALG